jgi:hypothetical protein
MKNLHLSDTPLHLMEAMAQYFLLTQSLPEHFYCTMKRGGKIFGVFSIILFIFLSIGNSSWTLPCSWMVRLSVSMVESMMLSVTGLMFYAMTQEALIYYSEQGKNFYQLEAYIFSTLENYENQKMLLCHLREEFDNLHGQYCENHAIVRAMTYELFEQQYRLVRDLCHKKAYPQALLEIAFIEQIKKHIIENIVPGSHIT